MGTQRISEKRFPDKEVFSGVENDMEDENTKVVNDAEKPPERAQGQTKAKLL